MIETLEPGDTPLFSWTGSLQPDSAPLFSITGPDGSVVTSFTSQSSDANNFYALYTIPSTPGYYVATWLAQRTVVGSVRNFVDKFSFQVKTVDVIFD